MTQNFILCALAVLVISVEPCWGEIYFFPKGSKPSVSMVDAFHICEISATKSIMKSFNPMEATLRGDESPTSGAWSFSQYEKDGTVYRFVVYFPEKICLIFNESSGMKLISSHRYDGTPIPELEAYTKLRANKVKSKDSISGDFVPIPQKDTQSVPQKDPFDK